MAIVPPSDANVNSPVSFPLPPMRAGVSLGEDERAILRDWYDQSGRWSERMSALYRIVESIVAARLDESLPLEIAWEQGWVARGNSWDSLDNPYRDGGAAE